MKDFFSLKYDTVPLKVPVIFFQKMFSTPKLYIPKIKGTNKPDISKSWYVFYYYRNNKTGKMQKFIEKRGINRFKNITQRKEAGNNLRKARHYLLQNGYSPFAFKEETQVLAETESFTISEALNIALKEKNKVWSESTIDVNRAMYNAFVKWLEKNNLSDKDIKELTKRHIVIFLNQLKKKDNTNASATTRNNHKRLISSLIAKLVADDIMDNNFVENIPLLKSNPQKNKPYTKKQLEAIKKYLLEKDTNLYEFMQFVMYALMRPIEVCRLQVKDVDLENNIIKVRTKTEVSATILIIEPLRRLLLKMNLEKYKPNDFLFSKEGKPSFWETEKEKSKVDFFGRRFQKLKKEIGDKIHLDKDHNIYSARHTVALDLYNSFKNQGLTDLEAKHKLMTITRHKSLSGLENYLRDIGASLPEDYSDDYTLNF